MSFGCYYWRGKAYNVRQQTARMVDDFEAFLKGERRFDVLDGKLERVDALHDALTGLRDALGRLSCAGCGEGGA